jgi:hypothetical protein
VGPGLTAYLGNPDEPHHRLRHPVEIAHGASAGMFRPGARASSRGHRMIALLDYTSS